MRQLFIRQGSGSPRPPEAVGLMLQILTISTFPEINYEFAILGQKSRIRRNFLKTSKKKEEIGQKSK